MSEEFDHRRAVFVLGKIDEILAWEKQRNHERDLRFVDLVRYLCGVRAGQYWRLEKMKSFDDSQAAWSVVLDCGSLLRTPKRLRNWF